LAHEFVGTMQNPYNAEIGKRLGDILDSVLFHCLHQRMGRSGVVPNVRFARNLVRAAHLVQAVGDDNLPVKPAQHFSHQLHLPSSFALRMAARSSGLSIVIV
jgi:hypothetical protein